MPKLYFVILVNSHIKEERIVIRDLKKTAHIQDIIDLLCTLDCNNCIRFFVVDAIGLASLPRINAKDISYFADN